MVSDGSMDPISLLFMNGIHLIFSRKVNRLTKYRTTQSILRTRFMNSAGDTAGTGEYR